MELRQLKTFQTVGTLLSFNRAAEALNYAQSTVSVQIRGLEEEFGVPLFDRLGKRVLLTEAGQLLMRYAQRMLDIEEETLSEVTGRSQPQGSLSVRIPQSLGTYYLPEILCKFHKAYPKVGFSVNSCAFHSLEQELKSGVTDVAFLLAESINARDLTFEVLHIEPLMMVASPGHALAKQPTVLTRDLHGRTIFLPMHDCSYKMVFEQTLTEEKVKTAAVIEMNSLEAIKQCVMKGVGITVIPNVCVKREIKEGKLVVLPWSEGILETAILMIWHKDKWISPTLQAFMDTFRDVMRSQAENVPNV